MRKGRKPIRKFQQGGHSHQHTHPKGGHQHPTKGTVRPTTPQDAGGALNCWCGCTPNNSQMSADTDMWSMYLQEMTESGYGGLWYITQAMPGVCLDQNDSDTACQMDCQLRCAEISFSTGNEMSYGNWPAGWFTYGGSECSHGGMPQTNNNRNNRRNTMRRGGRTRPVASRGRRMARGGVARGRRPAPRRMARGGVARGRRFQAGGGIPRGVVPKGGRFSDGLSAYSTKCPLGYELQADGQCSREYQ